MHMLVFLGELRSRSTGRSVAVRVYEGIPRATAVFPQFHVKNLQHRHFLYPKTSIRSTECRILCKLQKLDMERARVFISCPPRKHPQHRN